MNYLLLQVELVMKTRVFLQAPTIQKLLQNFEHSTSNTMNRVVSGKLRLLTQGPGVEMLYYMIIYTTI